MARWLVASLSILVATPALRAQNAAVEPPKVGQPADFSQVVGVMRIKATATPTTVAVEEPITLTVTITGPAFPPYVPTRAGLRLFPPDLQRDFFLEPVNDIAKDGAWDFVYRLRPKHQGVKFIPSLKLVYYAPRQRRYQTAYTEAIPLTVQPRRTADLVIPGLKVIQAPAMFFEAAPEEDALFWYLPAWAIALIVLLTPAACAAGAWWQRRRHIVRSKRQLQRRRATQQALAALANLHDADAAGAAVAEYLQHSLDFPAREPTPFELERWLKRRGVAGPLRLQCRQLLARCHEMRFAPAGTALPDDIVQNAALVINALENEPCLAAR